ncbi:MAG: CBS domain-containing protein, partial [Rhodospirillales bacterium]
MERLRPDPGRSGHGAGRLSAPPLRFCQGTPLGLAGGRLFAHSDATGHRARFRRSPSGLSRAPGPCPPGPPRPRPGSGGLKLPAHLRFAADPRKPARRRPGSDQRAYPFRRRHLPRNAGTALRSGKNYRRTERAMKLDTSSLERIDSFPYRHKVAEVMSAPVVSVPKQSTLIEAARLMAEKGISSILVGGTDGHALGIVTERDVLRAVAQTGSIGMHQPLSAVMSAPVATVREEALVFVALGRMDRLKIRHLVVVDRQGQPVGMVSARSLLKLRAGSALALGDEIGTAPDAKALAQAHAKVPALAQALLDEGVEATGIANVVSTVLRDITARAAELAEQAMAEDGWGGPPVPGCLLILGSGGRGESLFGADQDNAIIYDGGPEADPWYAEISRRICETLDQAGVPNCKGGVMCVNAQWRRSQDGWKAEIDRWMRQAKGEDVLNIDIFVDFKPVYGTQA